MEPSLRAEWGPWTPPPRLPDPAPMVSTLAGLGRVLPAVLVPRASFRENGDLGGLVFWCPPSPSRFLTPALQRCCCRQRWMDG